MGWMQRLVETYENVKDTTAPTDRAQPLALVGFVEKRAGIHVIITHRGEFGSAHPFAAGEDRFLVPSTPEAEGRTGTQIIPYPLFDELRCVAGDITGGENPHFDAYLLALNAWCEESGAPPKLKTLRDYLAKGRLAQDLEAWGHSFDREKDLKTFVMFSVQVIGGESRLWLCEDVRESWRARLSSRPGARKLCYATGEQLPELTSYPKLQGNAKIISAKDVQTPFQYKGRFTEAGEAVTVSYDASAKAHNALGWLLKRQGFDRYGIKVVAWATNGCRLCSPADDNPFSESPEDDEVPPATFEDYGEALRNAALGLSRRIASFRPDVTSAVVVLGLQAATTGRMSINYYQELHASEYAERLLFWYDSCKWEMYRKTRYIATPTPDEITAAVLGKRSLDDTKGEKPASKLVRQLRLRILKCTIEASPLPRDIAQSALRRASAPLTFTNQNGKWQESDWRSALAVACALIRKTQIDQGKEGANVKLDERNDERSYLFGRLLALADVAEYSAMDKDAYRQTNAVRYMQMFQQRPHDTWLKLHGLLIPYFGKLGAYAERYKKLIGEVEVLFREGDRMRKEPLNGNYLHGYYCQRQALFTKGNKAEGEKTHDDTEE